MGAILMTDSNIFIRNSIEINLFFQRIMKEHLFFIQISLQPVQNSLIMKANDLKHKVESLLARTVKYAQGLVTGNIVKAGEIVTSYTLIAEQLTSKLTGAAINTAITKSEYEVIHNPQKSVDYRLEGAVLDINKKSLNLLKEVIDFKLQLIELVSECKIFINLYNEMLVHDALEAKYYLEILQALNEKKAFRKTLCETLDFWNGIMVDHAQFVDGLLDPKERLLKEKVATFSEGFERLKSSCNVNSSKEILKKSIESAVGLRDFKGSATEKILKCKIKSIIPPLLADHILREANYYLKLLSIINKKV